MNFNPDKFYKTAFWASLGGVLAFVADFGFSQSEESQIFLNGFYFVILATGILSTVLRYYTRIKQIQAKVFMFDLLTVLFTLGVFYFHFRSKESQQYHAIFYNDNWIKFAIFFTFIREFSELNLNFKRAALNPAQLFIGSFLGLILTGSLLLMLPNATHTGISYLDALFTSTSAVCVTGLIVVDTGSYFTHFGQVIIMLLIQVGGLGILTFASYFSYFFKGGASFENQLTLSDLTSSRKIGEVFSTLKYVLVITFTVEAFAAFFIFVSLEDQYFQSFYGKVFFSVFHAVSAFCNAGFSTLANNLYEIGYRYNYFLQMVVVMTFILGGLGFPIVVNILDFIKYSLLKLIPFRTGKRKHKPWLLNLNSRITLVTTLSLTTVAFFIFFINEYHNTLAGHEGMGKVVTALFGAATPRTAGFNTVDMAALNFSTLIMVFLLMWIGASPASTGGGIKTSTFAIAILNILSLARGKSKIEIFRREVAGISVRRAFAVISLSLIVIGCGIMLISIFDSEKDLLSISFECFSAYSTVGLSVGITNSLSDAGKLVIITVMFVGRVGMLALVIAVFKKVKHKNYRFPIEEITIN